MKVSSTIQARMGSTRFPGKVLKIICGKPMLALQIERIRQSRLIDEIIVATSDSAQDDPIEALARSVGVLCFRGSQDDVLSRVVGALRAHKVDVHAEFMGDNPMPDPLLIDSIIGFYLKNRDRYDYVTNALRTTYPPGAEVSVYPAEILYDAERYASDKKLREHVGMHIFQYPERYRIWNIEAPEWLRFPDFHLEVDTEQDFEVISGIFEALYPSNPGFSLTQAIDYLKAHPGLAEKNIKVERRWKAFRKD